MKKYTVDVQEDREGLYIPLPDDLMEEAGWILGDDLEWIDNNNGTWTLRKIE